MIKPFLISTGLLIASGAAYAQSTQYDLRVDGMTCPFCVATSERALKKIDGVESVKTDLEDGVIHVCTDETVSFTDEELTELFLDKGFTYRGMETSQSCSITEGDDNKNG